MKTQKIRIHIRIHRMTIVTALFSALIGVKQPKMNSEILPGGAPAKTVVKK